MGEDKDISTEMDIKIREIENFIKEAFVVDDCEAGMLKTDLEDVGYSRMDFKLECERRGTFFITMYAPPDWECDDGELVE